MHTIKCIKNIQNSKNKNSIYLKNLEKKLQI